MTGLLHPGSTQGGHLLLALLLSAAALIDWRSFRLPNWLTVGGCLLGLVWAALPGGIDFTDSLTGAAFGLFALLPVYALRMIGAGDVKLMAAVGAFLGFPSIVFAVLFTFIAGGVVALAFAAWRRNVARMLVNARDLLQVSALAAVHGQRPVLGAIASTGKLPYGLCICAGTLAWLSRVYFFA